MVSQELVSIVIPAFNCAETVGSAVQSCLDQTYGNIEVIVVNDGSTDGTPVALAPFGDRIQVVHQANRGLAAARSAGQQAARGTLLAWMDGDDLARPERIRMQVAALQALPEAGLVCSNFSAFHDSAGDFDFDPAHIDSYYESLRKSGGIAGVFPMEKIMQIDDIQAPVSLRWGHVYEKLLAGNFVHPPTVLARRSLLDRAGEFDSTLRYSSDYDLLLRASRAAPFAYIATPLLRYRRSPRQMSAAAVTGKLQLETVRILEKIRRDDADLELRRGNDLRRLSAEALLSAAYALARTDRAEGLHLVRKAFAQRFLPVASLRTLARLAAPNALIDALKRARKSGSASLAALFLDTEEMQGILDLALWAAVSLN